MYNCIFKTKQVLSRFRHAWGASFFFCNNVYWPGVLLGFRNYTLLPRFGLCYCFLIMTPKLNFGFKVRKRFLNLCHSFTWHTDYPEGLQTL